MTIEETLAYINKTFVYKGDKQYFDKWTIMKEPFTGDCEDYSLTAIYYANNKSIIKFIISLILYQYVIYFVKAPSGEGHVVTCHKGMYFDNIQGKLVTKEKLIQDNYTEFFLLPFPIVFLKMIISKVMK